MKTILFHMFYIGVFLGGSMLIPIEDAMGLPSVSGKNQSAVDTVNQVSNGCVMFTIDPKILYGPFDVQIQSFQPLSYRTEVRVEDNIRIFDSAMQKTGVPAEATLTVNYIDRGGQVVPGETESGQSGPPTTGSSINCSNKISLDFGLKATAGSFERLNLPDEAKALRVAEAYYQAIDPDSTKTTLNDWKKANGFLVVDNDASFVGEDSPGLDPPTLGSDRIPRRAKKKGKRRAHTPKRPVLPQVEPQSIGDDASAIYFNHGDLGFGRDMHMKRYGENGKNLAFYVTNYRSLEDTIAREAPIATVAMEYSFGSRKGKNVSRYIQFYAFGADGERVTKADLDGRGEKYLPNLCMTCHGGKQGEVLTTSNLPDSGGIGARFLPFDLNAFDFSEEDSRYTRAAQEGAMKIMNEAILDALPTEAMTELINGWYSGLTTSRSAMRDRENTKRSLKQLRSNNKKRRAGSGIRAQSVVGNQSLSDGVVTLNRATQNSEFVPLGWRGDHEELYTKIVAPYCRGCHITRAGTLDWSTFADFVAYSGPIKDKVCKQDKDTMPNAKATYQNMWLSSVDPIDVFTRHGIFTMGVNDECGQGPWARP